MKGKRIQKYNLTRKTSLHDYSPNNRRSWLAETKTALHCIAASRHMAGTKWLNVISKNVRSCNVVAMSEQRSFTGHGDP